MMRRWLQRRAARKFFSNRLAVGAMFVVGLYLVLAIAVEGFGLITRQDVFRRVGYQTTPGLWFQQLPEKRAIDADFVLNRIELALKRNDPRAALDEFEFGQLKIVDQPPDQIQQTIDRAWELYDELDESDDLNNDPSLLPRLDELETITGSLFQPLAGAPAWIRSFEICLGTDNQGRSIFLRAIYSIGVAMKIGVVVALISVGLGSILGATAAYFGGWVDNVVTWLFTTFSSIPNLVLLVLLAYMFTGSIFEGTLIPLYIAFSATYWIGPCRVIRGETLKLKQLEYVQAAQALGRSRPMILLKHILPNASHLMLINFSLLFIAAIKGEVILTFLGLGLKNDTSWGIMITQSRPEVINGFFWQIGTATFMMFALVLAFNILSDALQDAFDPKQL